MILAIAHMSSEGDEYDGYYIPKGTIVIGNAWYAEPHLSTFNVLTETS